MTRRSCRCAAVQSGFRLHGCLVSDSPLETLGRQAACFRKLPHAQVQPTTEGVPANVSCVAAALHTPLLPGQSATLQTYAAHTKLLAPKPAEIRQDDVQRVVYSGNLFLLSPYPVQSQSLKA